MSSKWLKIAPNLSLDPDYVGGGTFALLAKKGAGKTYTGRVMAEELWAAKVPFAALDPMDAWWGLRSSADGNDEGIPVAIFGGPHGDAPLERTAGKLMADLLIDEGVSMVLSLKHLGSRAAERQFAMDFLDRLYRRNSELVHLLIDEADLFAPQKPQAGDQQLLGITENIVRRGRNNGIGVTLITQRPAVLNKDVLTQADGLVAMRMLGPQDRNAIDAWTGEHGDTKLAKELKASLPDLQNGECWWWVPELDVLKRVQVRRSRTFDSSPTKRRGEKRREPKSFADVDMDAIESKMSDSIERAKAENPRELRKRISELERSLADAKQSQPEPERVEVPAVDEEALECLQAAIDRAEALAGEVNESVAAAAGDVQNAAQSITAAARDAIAPLAAAYKAGAGPPVPPPPGARPTRARPTPPPAVPEPRPSDNGDGAALSSGAAGLLETLARRHPMRVSRSQLATLAGRSIKSSSFGLHIRELKSAALVGERADLLELTEAGVDVGGADQAAPQSRDEILDTWRRALQEGPRKMLDALLEHPDGIDRLELADAAGFSRTSSSVGTHIRTLRNNGLVVEEGGWVYPSELFFG